MEGDLIEQQGAQAALDIRHAPYIDQAITAMAWAGRARTIDSIEEGCQSLG